MIRLVVITNQGNHRPIHAYYLVTRYNSIFERKFIRLLYPLVVSQIYHKTTQRRRQFEVR